ncbi:MAG: DNA-binding protein [Acidobacteriota bacterium]|jgi:predicted DNA-binding protein with PD1-like motif
MKTAEGRIGRIFVLRLEHDDPLPRCIEAFAAENGIRLAQVMFHGGIYRGDLVAGPERTEDSKPEPIVLPIREAHESSALGFIAPSADGSPILHMHGNLGRKKETMSGCFQKGVSVWLVGEAVVYEILSDSSIARILDKDADLKLLDISD